MECYFTPSSIKYYLKMFLTPCTKLKQAKNKSLCLVLRLKGEVPSLLVRIILLSE